MKLDYHNIRVRSTDLQKRIFAANCAAALAVASCAAMRLKDYFAGIPVQLQSRLSAEILADRINNAAGSIFWPFNCGVIGGVRFGRVSLRYRSSFFEYNAKPILVGRLREQPFPLGAVLTLRYRAPAPIYVFYLFWYSFLSLFGLLLVGSVGQRNPDLTSGDLALSFVGWTFMIIFPLGLHFFGTRNSDEELSELLDFLAREAEAHPPPLLQPPHARQP